MRGVRLTFVAMESNKYYIFCVCICSLSYSARKAHAPYYIVNCGLSEWRKLHNEELNSLYSSPNIVRVVKPRRMRWAGHVTHMGEG